MEFFEKFVYILHNLFTQYPWLFPICIGIFFVLTIIGLIVQSNYEDKKNG